eukprot:gene9873-biopygen2103
MSELYPGGAARPQGRRGEGAPAGARRRGPCDAGPERRAGVIERVLTARERVPAPASRGRRGPCARTTGGRRSRPPVLPHHQRCLSRRARVPRSCAFGAPFGATGDTDRRNGSRAGRAASPPSRKCKCRREHNPTALLARSYTQLGPCWNPSPTTFANELRR